MKNFVKRLVSPEVMAAYHLVLAFLGAALFRFPSRKLIVIGVTGTNGKSTVVYFITRLLEDAGYRVAASSSIEFQIRERYWPNMHKMTMPGRFFLQKFLREAVEAECTHAVIEVTSEGAAQHRHRFLDWDIAVFLNLSPEHIERHGSYERYRAAKGELFRALKSKVPNPVPAGHLPKGDKFQTNLSAESGSAAGGKTQIPKTIVTNVADREAGYFLQFPADRYYGFRLQGQEAKAELPPGGHKVVAETIQNSKFKIQNSEFVTPLLGEFNIENWLAAITAGTALGLPFAQMQKTVARVTRVSGRLEEIPNDRGVRIFVDYAHTPAALESVYKTLKPICQSANRPISRLICVLGAAGGGRDKWKRPEFGKLAAQYCDKIILTNEDPYDEKPPAIIEDIERGFSQIPNPKSCPCGTSPEGRQTPNYEKILDRREAIRKAIAAAQTGDIVIITGKGCEPWMMGVYGQKIPWDDRTIVREALNRTESYG